MEKYKVNIDRSNVSDEEIDARSSFEALMGNYNILSKTQNSNWEIRSGKLVKKGFDSTTWIVSSVAVIAISMFVFMNYQKDEAIKELLSKKSSNQNSKSFIIKSSKSYPEEPRKTELKNNDQIKYSAEKNFEETELTEENLTADNFETTPSVDGPLAINSNLEIIEKESVADPLKNVGEKPLVNIFNNSTAESSVKVNEQSVISAEVKSLKGKQAREKQKLKLEGFSFGKGLKNKEKKESLSEKTEIFKKAITKSKKLEEVEHKKEEVESKKASQQIEQLSEEITKLKKEIEEKEKNNLLKPQRANPSKHQFNLGILSKEFPELAKLKGVLFEPGDENETFLPEHKEIEWENGAIKEGTKRGNYELTLTKGKTATTYIVYPVYIGKDFDNAMMEFNKYQNSIIELKQELRAKNYELKLLQSK